MKSKYLISILIITLFGSCAYNSEDDLIEPVVVEDFVTYDDNIKSIIDNNCINCHSSPPVNGAPTSLTTFEGVKAGVENGNLIERISTTDSGFLMPFGGPRLPQNLIDLVVQWEAEGLLEN